jgi:sugar lactone lactonase YvrE
MKRLRSHAIAAVVLALVTILSAFATAQDGTISSPAAKHPAVQVKPKKIDFGKLHAGMTSAPRGVAFTNKGNVELALPSVAVSGTGFALVPFTCPAPLPPRGSCGFGITFTPPLKGKFKGTLTFIDGGAHSPQKVKLSGIGLAPVPTPTPTITATPTATATATLTSTPTPTISGTPTISATPTPSVSATPTITLTPTITPTPKPEFQGVVYSGNNPVSGASVTVWTPGTSGYGTGATLATAATTAANGSFNSGIFSCASTDRLYVTAQGGNAGGGNNSSLMMMMSLPPCETIGFGGSTFTMNEQTTVGTVYALSQFMSTTSPGAVGAPFTNAAGIADASVTAADLVSAQPKTLNSLANALAACNQTNGSSAACTELFDCAMPGAVLSSGGCTGGTGSITDTLSAALSIARNPAGVSVAGINDVASKSTAYKPVLTSAPNDWSMQLNFGPIGSNFNEPFDVAIDSSSNVWVTNQNGSSVTVLNNDGSFVGNFNNSAPSGADFQEPQDVAIDSSGRAWIANSVSSSFSPTITALNNVGTLFGSFAPAGANFNFPSGVAIDNSGHVWVTNNAADTVVALNNNGTLYGSFAPNGSNFAGPIGVAIDSSSHVWVANETLNTVTALNNDGSLFGNFTNSAPSGANFNEPTWVAIDGSGQVWVTNFKGNTVTALNNNGTLLGNFDPGSNFVSPDGLAVDSAGHVWVTNAGAETITVLNNDGSLFGNLSLGSGSTEPNSVAIDSSGNVWVTNGEGTTVTELVGAASPVKTPLIGPPQLP